MEDKITAICQECGKQFDYVLKPGFPRKYCVECSAIKKAQFANKDKAVEVVKPGVNVKVDGTYVGNNPTNKTATSIVINQTEKPHSYEFGPAGQRHKIYYATVLELKDQIQQLKAQDLIFESLE